MSSNNSNIETMEILNNDSDTPLTKPKKSKSHNKPIKVYDQNETTIDEEPIKPIKVKKPRSQAQIEQLKVAVQKRQENLVKKKITNATKILESNGIKIPIEDEIIDPPAKTKTTKPKVPGVEKVAQVKAKQLMSDSSSSEEEIIIKKVKKPKKKRVIKVEVSESESSSDEEPIKQTEGSHCGPIYNKPNFKSQQYSKPNPRFPEGKNESVIKTYNDSKPKYFFAD